MHQHKIAVFDLGWEHTELRLDVRARIVICHDQFVVCCASSLREGIAAPKREDIKIVVQTADEWTVIVRHNDVSRALRENVVQFFVLFLRKVNGV